MICVLHLTQEFFKEKVGQSHGKRQSIAGKHFQFLMMSLFSIREQKTQIHEGNEKI